MYKLITVLFVLSIVCLKSSDAVMCYNCTSTNDQNCRDPFNIGLFALVDCDYHYDFKHKYTFCRKIATDLQKNVIRTCDYSETNSKPECITTGNATHVSVSCSCNTRGCNSSHRLAISSLVYVISIIVLYLSHRILD